MRKKFQLIDETHQQTLKKLAEKAGKISDTEMVNELKRLIEKIRDDIPEKKRISYGRYSIIKKMGQMFYPLLKENDIDIFEFAQPLFSCAEFDQFVRSLAVQLISFYGEESKDLDNVLAVFEEAAADDNWEMRECAAGFIRKLVRKYPAEMKTWYLKQTQSDSPLNRRFASESIRPVADNAWFKKSPDFCFTILKKLYREPEPYPRTSVGNNLSDWARIDKERVYPIIEKLANSGDKNSYWIAYRACRNLVKTEPERVMDLLRVDEYKYKKKVYKRK